MLDRSRKWNNNDVDVQAQFYVENFFFCAKPDKSASILYDSDLKETDGDKNVLN